jgi:hypothetical protein
MAGRRLPGDNASRPPLIDTTDRCSRLASFGSPQPDLFRIIWRMAPELLRKIGAYRTVYARIGRAAAFCNTTEVPQYTHAMARALWAKLMHGST